MTQKSAQDYTANVRLAFAVLVWLAVAIVPVPGLAGIGSGISGVASIDTRNPVVTVTNLPPNTVRQAHKSITLNWELNDDNPNPHPAANIAEMWIGDVLSDSLPFSPGTGQHDWTWSIPDTSSATVHLVVRSFDTFGNLTVEQSNYFTILSIASDVPLTASGPVFSRPSPNPFNPLTKLEFSLPEAGQARVTVHDARGFRVGTLLQSHRPAGSFTLQWDGTDEAGRRQAGGIYFFKLEYQDQGQTQQIVHKAVLLP